MVDILAFNQPYLSQSGFKEAFDAAGHRCLSIGWYNEGCDIVAEQEVLDIEEALALLPSGFTPERVVYFDHSEPIRIFGLETLSIPTVVHLVDTHIQIHKLWHPLLAGCFDDTLVAMRGCSHRFGGTAWIPSARWLPLWASRLGAAPNAARAVPVSFRGSFGETHPKRRTFFDGVRARVQGDFGQGSFFDLYNSSKIILNDCINADLNWRVFEALASGALLLTPQVSEETLELFPDGECLVTYKPHDVEDAVQKIEYYLGCDQERIRIATQGYQQLQTKHLAHHRARELLRIIENATPRPQADKAFSAVMTYLRISALFPFFHKERFLDAAQRALKTIMEMSDIDEAWMQEKWPLLCAACAAAQT